MKAKLLLLVLFLILGNIFTTKVNAAFTDNLQSYWKLEEATGTRVDSLGNNNLTSTNSVGQTTGIIGNGALFNSASSQILSIADNASLSTGGTDFTISLWVYMTSKASLQVFVSKYVSPAAGEFAIYYTTDDKFHCITYGGGVFDAASTIPISLNTWYNIVCMHDATAHTNTIQINNGAIVTRTGATEHSDSTASFVIGGYGSPPSSLYHNGRIDSVGFWKRKLTTTEVTALYANGNGFDYPFTTANPITTLSAYGDTTQVQLGWTAPADNGSAITDYNAEYKLSSSSTWIPFIDGTSTNNYMTITGLTDGSQYDFRVFAVNSNGNSSASNIATTTAMHLLFQDDFDALSNGAIDNQNGWVNSGTTSWTIGSGGGGKVLVAGAPGALATNYITQGNLNWTNQRVSVDFLAGTSKPIIWLRSLVRSGNQDGYTIFGSAGSWYMNRNSNDGSSIAFMTSTTDPITLTNGNWYTVEFSVVDNKDGVPVLEAYLYAQGGVRPDSPFLTYQDKAETFRSGYAALGSTSTTYDNFKVYGNTYENVKLISPTHDVAAAPNVATKGIPTDLGDVFYIPYIQTSTTLVVKASVGSTVLPVGGGIKFTLNKGLAGEQSSIDMTYPYSASFTSLAKANYTIDADVLNSSQVVQVGAGFNDTLTNVGIGDIYTIVGDSISAGYYGPTYGNTHFKTWLEAPGGTVSSDNRNYPQYITGPIYMNSFAKDLNDKLASYYSYPIFVMNEARSGATTTIFQSLITAEMVKSRQKALGANKWLMNLGVNDAVTMNAATYKSNMQTLLNTIVSSFGVSTQNIYLAKPMYSKVDPRKSGELTYLPVIDELVTENGTKTGPNFYSYFENYPNTYYNTGDDVHPNTAGINQFGKLWNISIISQLGGAVVQNANNAHISWSNMSGYESIINGYKIRYGTSPGTYTTTIDAGNVLSTDITGLSSGQTYYFAVSAYNNDGHTTSETRLSSEMSLAFNSVPPTGSVQINSNDATTTSTSATLTIAATDNIDIPSALQMKISNLADLSDASYEAYSTSKSWSLTAGLGTKTVYIQFKDTIGNESSVYFDDIDLVVVPTPTPTSSPTPTSTSTPTVTPTSTVVATVTTTPTTIKIGNDSNLPTITPSINNNGKFIRLKLLDENGNILSNIRVTISELNIKGLTDSDGYLNLGTITEKYYEIVFDNGSNKLTKSLNLTQDTETITLNFTTKEVTQQNAPAGPVDNLITIIIIICVTIGIVLFFVLRTLKKPDLDI